MRGLLRLEGALLRKAHRHDTRLALYSTADVGFALVARSACIIRATTEHGHVGLELSRSTRADAHAASTSSRAQSPLVPSRHHTLNPSSRSAPTSTAHATRAPTSPVPASVFICAGATKSRRRIYLRTSNARTRTFNQNSLMSGPHQHCAHSSVAPPVFLMALL